MSSLDMLDDLLYNKGRKYPHLTNKSKQLGNGSDQPLAAQDEEEAQRAVARLVDLKSSLRECDQVLARIQEYINAFHTDLKEVTADMDVLQAKSVGMTKRLQVRRDLEAVLGPAIERNIISPALIKAILEAPVNRAWLNHLEALERFDEDRHDAEPLKIEFPKEVVDKLRTVAIGRIRDYLANKIRSLRLPRANVQIIQQSGLLKMRKVYEFLYKHHSVLADEILHAYCLTMRWYYQVSFERYQRALTRIPILNIAKQELLGAEEGSRSLGTMFATNTAKSSNTTSLLQLGTRAKYLDDNTSGIILAHVAEIDREPHFLERVFRTYIIALVENAAVEYLFMNEFFKPQGRAIDTQYTSLFEELFTSATTFVKQLVSESLDVLGILICIRVCQRLTFDLQKRRVAKLEGFLDGLLIVLWPRLQAVMDAHTQAVQKAAVSVSSVNESAKTKQALPITRKFADILCGILQVSKTSREEEPIAHSLDRLVNDFQSSLLRMAATCVPKLRNQFLFRNYLYISEQLSRTSGAIAQKYKSSFEQYASSLET